MKPTGSYSKGKRMDEVSNWSIHNLSNWLVYIGEIN